MDETKEGKNRVIKFPKTPSSNEEELLKVAEVQTEAQVEDILNNENVLEEILDSVFEILTEAGIVQGSAVHPRVITTALSATLGYTLQGFTISGPDLTSTFDSLECMLGGAELYQEANPDDEDDE